MSKYQRWYDYIVDQATSRSIPQCYTELHHIKPRSLGGGDHPDNLVRLTYREHFLVHWLLTKICIGADLRKMQRAMFAMTMKVSGERITAAWQFEAAKRAIRDLEIDPIAEANWRERHRATVLAKQKQQRRSDHEFRTRIRPSQNIENRALVEGLVNGRPLTRWQLAKATDLLLVHQDRATRSSGKKTPLHSAARQKAHQANRLRDELLRIC